MQQLKYKCQHCDKSFSKMGIASHVWRRHTQKGKRFKSTFGKTSWRKGLNKSDPRIAKQSQTMKLRYDNGQIKPSQTGRTKINDESTRLSALKTKATIQRRVKAGTWHVSFAKRKTYDYKGFKFHGTWQLKYAKYLDENNVRWTKPVQGFDYFYEEEFHKYYPDFFLIDDDTYVQIKGYQTRKDRAKWRQFSHKLKVLKGKNLYDLGLIDSYREDKQLKNYHTVSSGERRDLISLDSCGQHADTVKDLRRQALKG